MILAPLVNKCRQLQCQDAQSCEKAYAEHLRAKQRSFSISNLEQCLWHGAELQDTLYV